MDDVKNKVDENVDENISKKNVQDKDGLIVPKTALDYDLGQLTGYLKCRLDGFQYTKKDIIKANIVGMFSGAAVLAVGHLIGQKLGNLFSITPSHPPCEKINIFLSQKRNNP